MAFKIEESFEVQAPINQAWRFLIDPRRVVVCLPGAEVTHVIDDVTYAGRVRVKVGPVTIAYKGTARLEEVNEEKYLMRLKGEGKDTGGSNSAKMSMMGRLSSEENGKTQVKMVSEIHIAGKMAQFGSGLIEDVSRQLFRQFAARMQGVLAQPTSNNDVSLQERDDMDVLPLKSQGSVFSVMLRIAWSRIKRLFGA